MGNAGKSITNHSKATRQSNHTVVQWAVQGAVETDRSGIALWSWEMLLGLVIFKLWPEDQVG